MPNTSDIGAWAQELWDYAVALYTQPGVAAQLLEWQDRDGANVNVCLLCLWAGTRGRGLTPADLGRAETAIAGWHAAATSPLRHLRRRLKNDWRELAVNAEPARQAVLAAELEAERAEQALLIRALAPWPSAQAAPERRRGTEIAAANLSAYLGSAATAAPAAIIAAIWSSE